MRKESRRWRHASLSNNAETYAVLEHGGPENAGDAVALHVSYSQSYGRKFVAVVEFELETAVVGSAGRCDDQCGEQAMMRKHDCDALDSDWSYSTHHSDCAGHLVDIGNS